jgi:hypothetical protein
MHTLLTLLKLAPSINHTSRGEIHRSRAGQILLYVITDYNRKYSRKTFGLIQVEVAEVFFI